MEYPFLQTIHSWISPSVEVEPYVAPQQDAVTQKILQVAAVCFEALRRFFLWAIQCIRQWCRIDSPSPVVQVQTEVETDEPPDSCTSPPLFDASSPPASVVTHSEISSPSISSDAACEEPDWENDYREQLGSSRWNRCVEVLNRFPLDTEDMLETVIRLSHAIGNEDAMFERALLGLHRPICSSEISPFRLDDAFPPPPDRNTLSIVLNNGKRVQVDKLFGLDLARCIPGQREFFVNDQLVQRNDTVTQRTVQQMYDAGLRERRDFLILSTLATQATWHDLLDHLRPAPENENIRWAYGKTFASIHIDIYEGIRRVSSHITGTIEMVANLQEGNMTSLDKPLFYDAKGTYDLSLDHANYKILMF